MKNLGKLLFITFLGIISLIIIMLYFWLRMFANQPLSNNPADWGSFADYFGGMLNSMIAVANLVFLIYISFLLSEKDDRRNVYTLKHQLIQDLMIVLDGVPRPQKHDKYLEDLENIYYDYKGAIRRNIHLIPAGEPHQAFDNAFDMLISKAQVYHAINFEHHGTGSEAELAFDELRHHFYRVYWYKRWDFFASIRQSME